MKYINAIRDEKSKDTAYIYTFAPLTEGEEIQWGHDDESADGLRVWRVVACSPCPYGL